MNCFCAARVCCLAAMLLLGTSFPRLFAAQEPSNKNEATGTSSPTLTTATPEPPPTPMQTFQEGVSLFRSAQFEAAARNFEIASSEQTDPLKKSHAYAWLARSYLHLQKIPEAESSAQKAIDLQKNSGNAQTALAEVYFREGRIAESEQLLKEILKSQAAVSRTYLALNNIYRATANYKTARVLIDRAHQLDPKDPDVEKTWFHSLTREERLKEWRNRLQEGKFEDEEERTNIAVNIALMEDREKNQNRSCRLASKISKTETKLTPLGDPRRLRGFGVNVRLNDTSAALLLDSGAGGILVSSKIAERAGLTKITDAPIGGIGDKGMASGYVAFAERLKIGDLEFENCYVDVIDKKRSLGEDGLIGTDVFESYLVDIDFPNSKLRLSQLPPYPDETNEMPTLQSEENAAPHLHDRWIPPEFAKYERVLRFGHMLLLPARLNEAPYRYFLLDTGAFDDTVTPAAAREAVKISKDSDIRVKGLNGEVKNVYTTGSLLFTFGHFQQRRQMVAFDMPNISKNVGTEISGTLGFAMLYLLEIKLDYRDNLVDFQYDPNRIH